MLTGKTKILICFGALLTFCTVVNCQREQSASPLRLQGQVTKIKLREQNKGAVVYDLNLHLQIINKGGKPLILLKREPWRGAEIIYATPDASSEREQLYSSSHFPSVYRAPGDEWEQLTKSLNKSAPPPEKTMI